MASPDDAPPRGGPASGDGGAASDVNNPDDSSPSKYHALVIDSGAIIKQTALSSSHRSLLSSAKHYYTVPAVLAEIRDAKSRQHLEEFQLRLQSLHDASLRTRTPGREAVAAVSEFARKTGDYSQLSGVDLQVLALLYDLEAEAAHLYNNGILDHVRREPKRVLGVSVKALNGDGRRDVARRERGGSVASSATGATSYGSVASNSAFFHGSADGIIDAANVDLEYDDGDDEEGDRVLCADDDVTTGADEEREDSSAAAAAAEGGGGPSKPRTWALLVNPDKASTKPLVDYSISASVAAWAKEEPKDTAIAEEPVLDADLKKDAPAPDVDGQFDDASDEEEEEDDEDEDDFSGASHDGELGVIDIANAASDEEMSDEECDVFILEPHEAAYLKKLKEEKAKEAELAGSRKQNGGDSGEPESEFPSLADAAAVPYEGSDDEGPEEFPEGGGKTDERRLAWEEEEEERKKKALRPMVNGRVVEGDKQSYDSFRRYKNVVSTDGAAVAMKQRKERSRSEEDDAPPQTGGPDEEEPSDDADDRGYRSRILGAAGAATAAADFPSEMTAEDDDGEGWVTCAQDIRTMKATGSLDLSNKHRGNSSAPRRDTGPPISQRAACATTDFAMQNVILQMNLELLSVDGVRVRRLKTWVTRCGACFTIYGNEEGRKTARLFCDKCGSNALQRIAASVDRNSGRLKLHMRKNYQHNTRGTKYSLPKAGKGNKYEGDLLLAEDQLLYGAWNQKLRKGKSKNSSQSIFGSDLASDMGCRADPTKRDDIRVGFGRRNPNAAKFGRERRGKKKKGTKDKACGLRRY